MEDRVPSHQVATTQLVRDELGIQRIYWPAFSLDFNPIKNI